MKGSRLTTNGAVSNRAPDFERFRSAVLRLGESDYVPLFEPSVADNVMSACLGESVCDPGRVGITLAPPKPDRGIAYLPSFIEFYAQAGYDYVPIKFGIGGQILTRLEDEDPAALGKARKTSDRVWGSEHNGFIGTWQDFKSFPWPEPGEVDLEVMHAASRLLPDGMRILAHAGGMLAHVRNYMGMEHFWMSLSDEPELPAALLRKLQELEFIAIDKATDCPAVGAFLLDDDLAHNQGLLENAEWLREHVFPFYRRVTEMVHAKNMPSVMHSCGNVTAALPDLIDCGINALHPIQPGAMDIAQVKKEFGHKLALLGNVDLNTLTSGTRAAVREGVLKLMRDVAPSGGFAIGSSASIADYVDVGNYLALLEYSLAYGRYPISA